MDMTWESLISQQSWWKTTKKQMPETGSSKSSWDCPSISYSYAWLQQHPASCNFFGTHCSWTEAKTRVVDYGFVGYGSFWFVAWKHLVQSVGYQGCNSIDPNICSESWFWGWEGNFYFTRIMSPIITFYVYLVWFDLNLSITESQLVLVLRLMKRNLQK